MEPAPLPTEEASHHRLMGEGVAKGEDIGRFLGEQPGVDQPPQDLDELGLVSSRHRLQQIEGEPLARHRGRLQHRQLVRIERVEVPKNRLAQIPWKLHIR